MKLSLDDLNRIQSPEELLDILNIDGPPFNPFEIVRHLPVKVIGNFDEEKLKYSGEIRVDASRKPVIWINPKDHINRRRFTLAHEIGHLINDVAPNINKRGVDDVFADTEVTLKRAGQKLPKEYAANSFAASLLMPAKQIKELAAAHFGFGQTGGGLMSAAMFISTMANTFLVSEKAMEIRLKELSIL